MSTVIVPASADEALAMGEAVAGFLADMDVASMPSEAIGRYLRAMERIGAIHAAAQGRMLEVYDAQDGPVADGQRTLRSWLVHSLRVTRGQAAAYRAVQALAAGHPVLLAALRDGGVLTTSVAVQLARWTQAIPDEYRNQAEEIVVAAARAGADLRALAQIVAEIRARTAPPDPDGPDPRLDRGVYVATTIDGAGVIRGDLTPACAAMVQAVLDALSAPVGGGDLRTHPERYHDALEDAMRRLLASGLLPARAGQPVKALVHIGFADLLKMDGDSRLQEAWIASYRARWAGFRAAASVSPGDGGAWLEGDAARAVACDAMIVPVVLGDIDPAAVEDLISLCVQYHRVRTQAPGGPGDAASPAGNGSTGTDGQPDVDGEVGKDGSPGTGTRPGSGGQADAGGHGGADGKPGPGPLDGTGGEGAVIPAGFGGSARSAAQAAAEEAAAADRVAEVLAMLEHQILAKVLQVVSGPGGVASFLRRHLLGKPLGGPSLPLDVGQTDDIPVHLRRLVALRDQTCAHPGGCDQPASRCEPHHVIHRADGGSTSLTNLKDYCWWHHHVLLHQKGWTLTVHPDGTSQVRSPAGKIIRSHSPPPRPG
jgi:Domain of unknown function (DUF222)